MMTKKDPIDKVSTRRTYLLLQIALFELLTEKPFEKITLTELCGRSLIPRSTFYRYFEDKHDLLRYCIQTFFQTARLSEDIIYFKDAYSIRSFLIIFIQMLNRQKGNYYKLYQTNKNGILMDILKEFLSDILITKLKESESHGAQLKISPAIFTYLLTDFYFSAAKCFLDLADSCLVEDFVDNVCMFSDKDFFV
ncbi:MAG: TetR/AcrR family transcriptional regulator [Lachnospiraceae bacterium]